MKIMLLALALLTLTLALAPHAAAQSTIVLDPVLSGLSSPLYVTNAHDGSNRLFIIEQAGRIKVRQPGSSTTTTFLDITARVLSGGERGLLGLAFHPQYATNRRFFVNYTRQTDGATVIAEYRTSASNPNVADTAEIVILVIGQPFSNHNGGMIEFGQDGYLYIGMGDGGSANDPGDRAQNINDLLGKMLRIDIDHPNGAVPYSSPADNPYFGATAGRDEIYAPGFRNPFRWSFDRGTGQLWAGDVGQGAREEIDIVTLGGNYGWRVFEGTLCTGLGPAPCTPANYVPPIAEYSHAAGRCSITGGYVYRGTQGTLPTGAYVYGDFCTGEIWMYQTGAPMQPLLDTTLSLASFGEDEAGEIYVVNLSGTLLRMRNPNPPTSNDVVWVEDAVPAGAVQGGTEPWTWVTSNPAPFSGTQAHQSTIAAGLHHHYFHSASQQLLIGTGDKLFTYVFIDPANVPTELMLQWFDGANWYNAYWGADNITQVSPRLRVGDLPPAGQWVRLEVPAASLGLEGRSLSGMSFVLAGGRATWDKAGKATTQVTPPTGTERVWVEDAIPTGGIPDGSEPWTWVTSNPTPHSGTQAHQSLLAAGIHHHYFHSATETFTVGLGERLFAYVYLDAQNPPSELMLQWHDGFQWKNAYWGADLIPQVGERVQAGPLPATGQWVRLEVPASALGLEGRTLLGMSYVLHGGRATWDRAGALTTGQTSGDVVWVEDAIPAGGVPAGSEPWTWASTNPAPFSGTQHHRSPTAAGIHHHYFQSATATLSVGSGEKLFAYIYLDAASPPAEVMLQWFDGTQWRNAYWGADLIPQVGERFNAGALPAAGQWVRLEVPAASVGLEGKTLSGMSFVLHGGGAAWDKAGKAP